MFAYCLLIFFSCRYELCKKQAKISKWRDGVPLLWILPLIVKYFGAAVLMLGRWAWEYIYAIPYSFGIIHLSCLASAGYVDGSIGAFLNFSLFEERTKIYKVANHSSQESLVSRKWCNACSKQYLLFKCIYSYTT
jgi:hypothetical protein